MKHNATPRPRQRRTNQDSQTQIDGRATVMPTGGIPNALDGLGIELTHEEIACMQPFDALVARIRGEYREMPGLGLTFSQACRLWQMDGPTCERVLEQLVGEAFLYKTAGGTYIALPTTAKRYVTVQPAQFSLRRSA